MRPTCWNASRASALLLLIAFAAAAGSSLAQSQQPYAGLEGRSVKALSEQQIADLRAGRGMGLALAAELNGYPGPMSRTPSGIASAFMVANSSCIFARC